MSKKRLAVLLMAAVLCITCMSGAFAMQAECLHENATYAELDAADVNVDVKHAVSCPDCTENWYEEHVYEETTNSKGDTCSLCGHVCTHASTHADKTVYADGSSDGSQHAVYCNNCGRRTVEKHNFNDNHVCQDCGYECQHNGSRKYEKIDAHQHYDICVFCNNTLVRSHSFVNGECFGCHFKCETHTYDKTKADGVCTICGLTCKHSYENSVCKTCGYKCEHENTAIRGLNAMKHSEYCKDCGYILNDTQENHIFNENHECTVCGTKCSHYGFYENGVCKLCKYECPHTTHDTNGVCTVCKMEVGHSFKEGVCEKCEFHCPHIDEETILVGGTVPTATTPGVGPDSVYKDCGVLYAKGAPIAPTNFTEMKEDVGDIVNDYYTLSGISGNYGIVLTAGDLAYDCDYDFEKSYEDNMAVLQKIVDDAKAEIDKIAANYADAFAEIEEYVAGMNNDRVIDIMKKSEAGLEGDIVSLYTAVLKQQYSAALDKGIDPSAAMQELKSTIAPIIELCAEANAVDEAAGNSKDAAILKLVDDFYAEVENMLMNAEGPELDISGISSETIAKINALKKPEVISAAFAAGAKVGEAVKLTVVTDTNAASVALCGENKAAVKTWTTGYADKNGQRTWSLSYTFTDAGSKKMYVKAVGSNKVDSELCAVSVTVADANAAVNSAKFAAPAYAGKAINITVTTNTNAATLTMCAENKAAVKTWTSGYTDANGVRTWKISYTFNAGGNRTLYFKAANKSGVYGALYEAKVTVNTIPTVKSAAFAADATAGKAVTVTVKTTTDAASLTMCAENKAAVKTWTEGYTDASGVRTWKISYTFNAAGNRTLYFKAANKSGVYGELLETKVTVDTLPTVKSAAFAAGAMAGKAVTVTVKTTTNAASLTMCAENKAAVKTWTSGYTDASGVRTWKISYTFNAGGNRTLYFKAANKSGVYGNLLETKVTVGTLPTVKSAAFAAGAMAGKAVTVTVKTTTDAASLTMCAENKAAVKTWTSGYTDASGVRTWKISYTFNAGGNRTLYFKAANKSGVYGNLLETKVTVAKKVEVKSAAFAKSTAKINEAVTVTVKTSTNAKNLALCAEGGSVCGTWSADAASKIVGSERVWTVSYKFGGAGNRNIGFKASEDGKTWSATVSAKITITK